MISGIIVNGLLGGPLVTDGLSAATIATSTWGVSVESVTTIEVVALEAS